MRRVPRGAEPVGFHDRVRVPGWRSLYEKAGLAVPTSHTGEGVTANLVRSSGRPVARVNVKGAPVGRVEDIPASKLKDYWTRALDVLAWDFGGCCGYASLRFSWSPNHSVDHHTAKEHDRFGAYHWSNLRYSARDVNGLKGTHPCCLDPFVLDSSDFFLSPFDGSLSVVAAPPSGLDPVQARLDIQRLGLDIKGVREARHALILRYHGMRVPYPGPPDKLSALGLVVESAFVAAQLLEQGLLDPQDEPVVIDLLARWPASVNQRPRPAIRAR